MNRFRDEIRIIPPVAWGIAILLYLGFAAFFLRFFGWTAGGLFPEPYSWAVLLAVLAPLPPVICVLLVGYVYRDAKRRAMRHVMWTWLAALIPNGIGIILYFVLREPLLVLCPACATPTRSGFAFCPKCGGSLAPACPQCRHTLEPGWSHCAFCGSQV